MIGGSGFIQTGEGIIELPGAIVGISTPVAQLNALIRGAGGPIHLAAQGEDLVITPGPIRLKDMLITGLIRDGYGTRRLNREATSRGGTIIGRRPCSSLPLGLNLPDQRPQSRVLQPDGLHVLVQRIFQVIDLLAEILKQVPELFRGCHIGGPSRSLPNHQADVVRELGRAPSGSVLVNRFNNNTQVH